MKVLLYGLVLLLLLFTSCKKEDEPKTPVYAGVYDETMNYMELNPVLQIVFVHDPNLNIDHGKDSLDIDQDGSYDIIFSQRNLLGNSPANANPNDIYPFCKLSVRNGVEVATKEESYYIGLGQSSSVNWVDTIAYRTNVTGIVNWSESDRTVPMWLSPPTIFWGSDGPWYNLANEEVYIAIRMKIRARYRYGWIKVMMISPQHISIISYALEK